MLRLGLRLGIGLGLRLILLLWLVPGLDKFMLWIGLELMIGSVLGLGLELKVGFES